jgi:hypothetical protein
MPASEYVDSCPGLADIASEHGFSRGITQPPVSQVPPEQTPPKVAYMVRHGPVRRNKIIGYILIGAIIVGMAFLAYWVLLAKEPDTRFRNIQKLRGGQVPVEVIYRTV